MTGLAWPLLGQSPPPPPLYTAAAVFDLARAALRNVPDEVAAANLAELAALEGCRDTAAAIPDALAALDQAVVLSREASGAGELARFQRLMAEHAARRSINLMRAPLCGVAKNFNPAATFPKILEEVRGFGLPRAQLYALLMDARSRWPEAGPEFDPQALAAECRRGDGSFPYGGVAPLPGTLLRTALTAAESETDWTAFPSILSMIRQALDHDPGQTMAAPEIDAAVAILKKLQAGPPANPPPPANEDLVFSCVSGGMLSSFGPDPGTDPLPLIKQQVGAGLLDLLTRLDASRAAEMRTEYGGPTSPACPSFDPPPPRWPAPDLSGGLAGILAQPEGPARMSSLLAFALGGNISPGDLTAAVEAMLASLSSSPALVDQFESRLEMLLPRLAAAPDRRALADSLADTLLAQAESELAEFQRKFDQASPDERAALEAAVSENAFPSGAGVFDYVAGFDPAKALAHARQAPALTQSQVYVMIALGLAKQ